MKTIQMQLTTSHTKQLLTTLSRLTKLNSWVFMLNPSLLPEENEIKEYGIDLSKILVVHCAQEKVQQHISKIMQNQHSSAVFSWTKDLNIAKTQSSQETLVHVDFKKDTGIESAFAA